MRFFQEPEESDFGRDAIAFTLGAVGGLAIGVMLSRRGAAEAPSRRLGDELRERARTVARRIRPARLRRMAVEQDELTELEDAVLDSFLEDEVLRERGIDVGAISPGIVELSGSVWTEEEAHHAVAVANRVPGVRTVVNRMEVEEQRPAPRRGSESGREPGGAGGLQHGVARTGGMGRRRQGRETDPDRPDDSQAQELEALAEADLDQFEREDLAYRNTENTGRPEVQRANPTNYDEDELDNQDPHGKHADVTLDRPPQDTNPGSRIGDGPKSAEHLRLEQADVPVKPHGDAGAEGQDGDTRRNG